MKTSLSKRALSVFLAVIMLFTMMPVVNVFAAKTVEVLNGQVSVTDSVGNGSLSNGVVTITATGSLFSKKTNNVTIKNETENEAKLSFDYSATTYNSFTIEGASVPGSDTYHVTLSGGASIELKLISNNGLSGTTATLKLSNFSLTVAAASSDVTFEYDSSLGSITVDGSAVQNGTTKEVSYATGTKLVATAKSGSKFYAWVDEATGVVLSEDSTFTLKPTTDMTVKALFTNASGKALFQVGAKVFDDLTAADTAATSGASKTIVVISDGKVSGSHTISKGITLLVPFNDDNTMYDKEPGCSSSFMNNAAWVKPTAYRTLTLASDADITVNGAISISGQHAASNGGKPYCGAPTGPVGWVKMLTGSKITLNSGANLYAWGYVQGAGTITAKSGATIYENFQFTDFRGGGNLSTIVGDGLVFPINQYYVQNIEVRTVYEAGAKETLYTTAYIKPSALGGSAPFIGEGGMFVINSGYIVKDYIENKDRLQVDIYGDVTMSSMTVKVSMEIDSSKYILPITNNISININSGTSTIGQSIALTPGVEMTVAKDATLVVGANTSSEGLNDFTSAGYHLVVYDYDEWLYGLDLNTLETVEDVNYAFGSSTNGFRALPYAPGRTYNRTVAKDMKDAILDVNGKIITDGFLYSTLGNAEIKSTGKTGMIVMNNGSGTDVAAFQANGGTSLINPINSVALLNGDGTYLYTGPTILDENILSAEPGTEFKYCADDDKWYTGECDGEKCNAPKEYLITWVVNGKTSSGDVAVGTVPVYEGSLEMDYTDNKHYTFAGWSTTANGSVLGNLPEVTADATYYAVFTEASHSYATASSDGKHKCTGCEKVASCGDKEGDEDHLCDLGCGAEFPGCTGGTATCTVKAKCTECGQSYGELKPHTEKTREENRKEATCGADGSYDLVTYCEVCKNVLATESKTITATGKHNYNSVVTKPTCTEEGFTTYTCSVCNDSYVADKVSAKGHKDADGDGDHLCDTCKAENITKHTKGEMVKENIEDETCDKAGKYDEVYYCIECEAEVERKNIEVPAKNHKWGEATYSWSDDGKECTATRVCGNDGTHTESETVKAVGAPDKNRPATCTEMGWTVYTADFKAEWTITKTKDVQDIAVVPHTPAKAVEENRKEATCYAEGSYDEVVYCSVCEAAGKKTEISRETKTINKKDHTPAEEVIENYVDSTCYAEGSYDEVVYCSVEKCKEKLSSTPKTIEKKKHTPAEAVTENLVDSTCYAEGSYDEVVYCSVEKCKEKLSSTPKTIEKKKHTPAEAVTENFKDSTCYAEGSYDEVVYCSVEKCKEKLSSTPKTIEKKKHTPAEAVTENLVDSTCYAEGSYDEVVYCSVEKCKEKLSSTPKTIEKKKHTPAEAVTENLVDSTCYAEGSYDEVVYCSVDACKYEISRTPKTIEKVAHTPAEAVTENYVDSTCAAEGSYDVVVYCSACEAAGKKTELSRETETITKKPHTEKTREEVINNATCDAEGSYDVVVYCIECGKELSRENKTADKKDHDWNEEITYSWSADGKECTATRVCASFASHKETETVTAVGAPDAKRTATCTEMGWTIYTADFNADWAGIAKTDRQDVAELGHGSEEGFDYVDNKNGTHNAICKDCGETSDVNVDCDYDETTHKCVCDAVETFTVTLKDYNTKEQKFGTLEIPYGAKVFDYLETVEVKDFAYKVSYIDGVFSFSGEWLDAENNKITEEFTMPGEDITVFAYMLFTGWEHCGNDNWSYAIKSETQTGWREIDGEWYYLAPDESYIALRATGITRAPYPTEKIDGVTYAPNSTDKAYWESHKDKSSYTDAETAMFVFDEDGRFNAVTGIVDGNRYALKGMIGWHPGLVEVDGDYYYFLGDKNGGGNVMATGDTYVTRGTTDEFVNGGIYTFGEDGKLCEYDGITEVDGVLRYYKDNRLATGEGLIKVDGDYYYVRTNGELAVNAKYWVSKVNDYSIVAGEYQFDKNGKMINPVDPEIYDGIVKVDGFYYYYINGKKQVNTGVQKLTDENGKTFYIYVTSNGELATGEYWPTNRNDLLDRGCYDWGTDGKYYPTVPEKKDGIVEIDGLYYYYIDGKKQANTGVQKLEDENGKTFYIYVTSSGKLATGEYWPSNRNGLLDKGCYNWGTDGKYYPTVPEKKNGIIEIDGLYYYYIDGEKQANTGVQKLKDEEGKTFYIYVTSSGKLATGEYWPSNRNDLLERGCYDWGTDGRYYPA